MRVGNHTSGAPFLTEAQRHLERHRSNKGGPTDLTDYITIPWRASDEESGREQFLLLRAHTLAAELADYAADDEGATTALTPLERIRAHLKELRDGDTESLTFVTDDDIRWRALRQQLFAAWQLAVRDYRKNQLSESRDVLNDAIAIAEEMYPQSDGLLTQLYYGKAKLCLRARDFAGATTHFRKSLASASLRFANATMGGAEREAAQYSVAKALTLGLAQCFLDQGRMDEAETVAVSGHMLLELTPDVVHRTFARQILGAIQRSSSHDGDTERLSQARKNLTSCRDFFLDRKAATAAFRSRYELALIDLHERNLPTAEDALRALLTDAENAVSHKWMTLARIGLSRVARRAGDFTTAFREADQARMVASRYGLTALEIKARTAIVQTRFEQHAESPQHLSDVEKDAQDLLRDIPEHDVRNRVVVLLVLVRIIAGRRDLRRARFEFDRYERIAHLVQSPRIGQLADLALEAIYPTVGGFRCPVDRTPRTFNLQANIDAVKEHVIRRTEDYYNHDARVIADALDLPRSTYYRRRKSYHIAPEKDSEEENEQ
jgi:tetratricopeptide (TPR) repeat protein